MKLFILIGGLTLRFAWVALRGLSRDELTSLGYIFEPTWQSVFWDNAPPTFYVFMKSLWGVSGSEWVLRIAAFGISATSFVLFFQFLDREEKNLWLLGFWALSPTSVVNATFRPTILAELAGIVFFLALRSGKTWKIVVSIAALAASTFVAFLAPLVAASEIDLREKKNRFLLVAGAFAGIYGATRINWGALGWLGTDRVGDLLESSVLLLSQLWGFSLPLFLAVLWVLFTNRKITRPLVLIVALAFVGPLVLGHRFGSSRFFILCTPWVLMSIAQVLRLRRDFAAGALIVIIPAITTFWFLKHEKSGWSEAGRQLAKKEEKAIFFAPSSLAHYFSDRFEAAEPEMDRAISRQLPNGGWVVRANPDRDVGMNSFLANRGNADYLPIEVLNFGHDSLEPVRAVKVARRPLH